MMLSLNSYAQTTVVNCPEGYICLTQAEANAARDKAKELEAANGKILVLEDSLKKKDESIKEIQDTARKNLDDMKDTLHKTEVELARTNGLLVGTQSENVTLKAMVEFLNKNGRKKCQPFSLCIN